MIHIRPATADDAPDIARIHIDSRREALPYLPELHTDEDTLGWIRDVVMPVQTVLVAVVDGVVAGYMSLNGDELNNLYVRPGAQGRGIGSALLAEAKRLSPGRLYPWTFQRNTAARAFYERHGFRVVEMTNGSGNEEREPDVRYAWNRGPEEL